jgi:hypothetical protein
MKKFEIKVIPIVKYPDLLRKIKILPKYFNEISGKKNDEIIEMAPEIIANCLPDVLAIFAEATNTTVPELEQLGFTDLVDIFIEVVKVNRFDEAIAKLKKGFAQNREKVIEN